MRLIRPTVRPRLPNTSRSRPGLPSPAMWSSLRIRLTRSWRISAGRPGLRWKKRKRPRNRRPGLPRRSILPLKRGSPKSRAVAVPRNLKRRSTPRRSLKKRRRRPGPARAARLRLTRRPPARPSRPNETNCPEVAGKRPRLRLPRMPGKVLPQRRLLPRSRPRRSLLCRPVPLRRASWFI